MNSSNFLKISGIFLVGVLILPQVTFAAVWWNPISWFNKNTAPTVVESELDLTSTSNTQENNVENNIKIEPKAEVRERIIERTIKVDNPELQKRIDELFKENLDLKNRIISLTAELNSYKGRTSGTTSLDNDYSDYNFKYRVSDNVINLLGGTSRALKIRKAVFTVRPGYSETFQERFKKSDVQGILDIAERTYKLERTNDTTFSYLGNGIPIVGSEDITIKVSGSDGVTYRMVPDWSLWEIWDYTTGKPVRIE